MKFYYMIAIVIAISFIHSVFADETDFIPVSGFELDKYLGKWYEIVRYPHSFEKSLVNVTATYSMREDGKVDVLNEGYKNTKDGKYKNAHGKAKFAGKKDIGYLKVSFFLFFYGDYIILELDKENYQYVLISSNSYKYLWILSRTPELDENILNSMLDKAKKLGFDLDKLIMVPQDWN